MNGKVINRIQNWKFQSALKMMEPEAEEYQIVKALAEMFGDCGIFDGKMGLIVTIVVSYLICEEEVEE